MAFVLVACSSVLVFATMSSNRSLSPSFSFAALSKDLTFDEIVSISPFTFLIASSEALFCSTMASLALDISTSSVFFSVSSEATLAKARSALSL